MKKSGHQVAEKIGQRIFIDISSVKNREFSELEQTSRPYWRILVDEKTQLKFSDFYETKIGMVEPTCELFSRWSAMKGIMLNSYDVMKEVQEYCPQKEITEFCMENASSI